MARKFKPLTLGSLPRVMVNILALNRATITAFYTAMTDCAEMPSWFGVVRFIPSHDHTDFATLEASTRECLTIFFLRILNMSKSVRSFFIKDFDRLLDTLEEQDFWGTEGQCDPRGDRRG